MIDLKKFLKMQLWGWKNKEFWRWQSSQRIKGYEWHHLLKRQNSDLFVVNIPAEQHKRIEAQGYKDGEFEELFIQAILNIEKFIDSKTK
jgi:hypothetical protein